MKWSSLFSRKRTVNDNMVSVESKTGFRFMPYTLVIALALLAFSVYPQPQAQEGEATNDPSAITVTTETPEVVVVEATTPELAVPEVVTEEPIVETVPDVAVPPDVPATSDVAAPQIPELTAPSGATPTPETVAVPQLTTPEGETISPEALIEDDAFLRMLTGNQPVDIEAGPIVTLPVDDSAAETEDKTIDWGAIFISVGVFLLVLCGSIFLANAAAKSWRMPEHTFKFFLILFTCIGSVTATCLSWKEHLTLGIDLSGGVVLIYDVKPHSSHDGQVSDGLVSQDDFSGLLGSVKDRINPAGIKEIDVRKYGTSQIKIVIPKADSAEVRRIEKLISESGSLEFRILASRSLASDRAVIRQAETQVGVTNIYLDGVLAAKWVPINPNELGQFVGSPVHVVRQTGAIYEVLVLKDHYDVTGEYLRNIHSGSFSNEDNPIPRPGVAFSLNAIGSTLFRDLTSDRTIGALGKGSQNRRFLGIIMSGEMYSAPTLETPISGGGCNITFNPRQGDEDNKQLQKDIQDLMQVMRAGALPADISKQPISRNEMGPTLGDATIRNSQISAVVAIIGVFAFMIFYYRASGVVACLAVTMNIFLIMTVMLSIRAAFTLAGLAGLVLTLGMAVDANILIFERLREELLAGSTLRHAIRNAFARASSAIIDSNLTTLIVAIILYTVGTEQTRGFAVTLFLGVVFTMYTAVFCSHVVFEVLERRGWLTKVSMLRIVDKPNINFMGMRKASVTIFMALCVLSLLFAAVRGKHMYDIDFVGGVSVDVAFKNDVTINTQDVEKKLVEAGIDRPTVSTVRDAVTASSQVESADQIGDRFTISTATPVGMEANDYLNLVTEKIAEQFEGQLILDTIKFDLQESQGTTGSAETVANIVVYPSMNYKSLDQYLKDYSARMVDEGKLTDPLTYLIVNEEDADASKSSKSYSDWKVTFYSPKADVENVMNVFQTEFNKTPWFPASNTIGSVVAGYAQVASLAAILASFVAIVLYLWLRFHKIYFGLAAVVTLINNVLLTMGALVISVWLKPVLGFMMIDDFKIGLTVVAAFLTVIGYSLNDTIILFDRIREIRGKSQYLTVDHINQSVNQVLSRTLLTSITTLYTIIVLYFFAGAGLRAFAFALGVGVVAGTFGSIFLASPLLYWMVNNPGKVEKTKAEKPGKYDRKPQ